MKQSSISGCLYTCDIDHFLLILRSQLIHEAIALLLIKARDTELG